MESSLHQAPPSMGFSRQEDWSGLPFPSPGNLPKPGIEPRSLTVDRRFTIWAITILKPSKISFYCLFFRFLLCSFFSFSNVKKELSIPISQPPVSLQPSPWPICTWPLLLIRLPRTFQLPNPPHPEMEQDSVVLVPAASSPLPACCLWKTLAKE